MNEHTPSTDDVREHYLATAEDKPEFDRWLLAERAGIWEEGYRQGWDDRNEDFQAGYVPSGFQQDTVNPYRPR